MRLRQKCLWYDVKTFAGSTVLSHGFTIVRLAEAERARLLQHMPKADSQSDNRLHDSREDAESSQSGKAITYPCTKCLLDLPCSTSTEYKVPAPCIESYSSTYAKRILASSPRLMSPLLYVVRMCKSQYA